MHSCLEGRHWLPRTSYTALSRWVAAVWRRALATATFASFSSVSPARAAAGNCMLHGIRTLGALRYTA